jgi:hypothetical protein
MMQTDRRQMARYAMEIPVSIRMTELPGAEARSGVSSNISASGLCMATDLQLKVGTPVEISMRMPRQVTGKPEGEWRCMGRVVRVTANEPSSTKPSVGVQFHYYEVLNKEGARLQN